jgi:4-amino-4-deoxy-L-arabinose transferase-like glycosyltransferase
MDLGQFVTPDEPTWSKRSAAFYYALANQEYAETYRTGHPGVTTMWAGAAAYYLNFPDYEKLGQVEIGDTKLFQLFKNHEVIPIKIIATARLFVALTVISTLILSFYFARRLFGTLIALLIFILIAFNPSLVAHARFLHTNGLVSSFMLLSLLAFIDYLRSRKLIGLLISGVAAGLSFITVTPGFLLVPVIILLTFVFFPFTGAADNQTRLNVKKLAKLVIGPLLVWGLIALVAVALIWPAMWGDPVGTLGNIFNYMVGAAGGETGGVEYLKAYQTKASYTQLHLDFYPLTYLWRTTPVTLIGLSLGAVALFLPHKPLTNIVKDKRIIWGLLIFILVFTVIMSFGTRKFDRYLLPVYPILDMFAMLGWIVFANWLVEKFSTLKKIHFNYWIVIAVLVIQLAGTLKTSPFYITYFNPLLGGIQKATDVLLVGWGEGISEAAIYLKEVPDIRKKQILSWYPLVFNWYSLSLGYQAQFTEFDPNMGEQDYKNFDYIIVYINQIQRNYPESLLEYIEGQTPIHTISIDGVDFVHIYKPYHSDTNP